MRAGEGVMSSTLRIVPAVVLGLSLARSMWAVISTTEATVAAEASGVSVMDENEA
jgi:hypothetical protein